MSLALVISLSFIFAFFVDSYFYYLEKLWSKQFHSGLDDLSLTGGIDYYTPIPKRTFLIILLRSVFLLILAAIVSKYFYWGKVIFVVVSLFFFIRKLIEPMNIKRRYLLNPNVPVSTDRAVILSNLNSVLEKADFHLGLTSFNRKNGTNYTEKDIVKDQSKRQYLFAISILISGAILYIKFFSKIL